MSRRQRAWPWPRRHGRTLWLALAALLVALALLQPRMTLPQEVYRYVMVFDITQSMNTRDYHRAGWPEDRLGYAKQAVRESIKALPCGSEVGLGLFTTQTVQLLFEPLEVCTHLPIIDDVLNHIDWRMAWSADTHVETGLYHAIREVRKRDAGLRLVFLTDGQETPPQTVQPQFDGSPGEVPGLLVGVGGTAPVTVPRYDRENRPLGIWENADIEKPPVSTTVYSVKVETRSLPAEGPYLSWLDEAHLKVLSAGTGLRYLRLDDPAAFMAFMTRAEFAERRPTSTDVRPHLAGMALLLLALSYGYERRRGSHGKGKPPGHGRVKGFRRSAG